jgi:hypothetical protein
VRSPPGCPNCCAPVRSLRTFSVDRCSVRMASKATRTTRALTTGLFDGIFQCPLHIDTNEPGVLPAGAVELKAAPAPMRLKLKKMNKSQRYLRCPIEQTFGHIKQWGIVGESIFRGNLDQQGDNFVLCMQLSARMMRVRGKYPRGDRWLAGEKDL